MRSIPLLLLAVLLLLAACSGPASTPTMSSSQMGTSLDELLQAGGTVTSAPQWDDVGVHAIGLVDPSTLPPAPTGKLLRGRYTYDAGTSSWIFVATSNDLELVWTDDVDDYLLVIDWDANSPTEDVRNELGELHEVPAGAGATLSSAANGELGTFALGSAWATNQCDYEEPRAVSLSGALGDDDARLTLDRLELELSHSAGSDTLEIGFGASAEIGDDAVAAYLDLRTNGALERADDCVITGFEVSSGYFSGGLSTEVAGEHRSLELRTDFSGLEYTSTSLLGVDLNGSLRLDGELAVLFSGWLGDGDKNGVPGEALQLTFAGGQTLTLEEFLIDQFGIASLAAARLLLR